MLTHETTRLRSDRSRWGTASVVTPPDRMRLQRGAEHLHSLGARATAEFLAEVAAQIGGLPCILGLLAEYERRLTPAMIRAAGADRFPPRPLREAPQC